MDDINTIIYASAGGVLVISIIIVSIFGLEKSLAFFANTVRYIMEIGSRTVGIMMGSKPAFVVDAQMHSRERAERAKDH
eukprot:CAMPEP_0184699576 /NCGR_PEP_ID=MMETSP0313-20130426/5810_1 /TAXON_ID=2792 /ORGANISM="Porphyridium aerugineum, Strain SAG 1380-2" /LENGTH=78 /DNA_ID=CAMNT_0027158695 /DNA_START=148 /DNA_END=384 /DNA_ORIENTATION=-